MDKEVSMSVVGKHTRIISASNQRYVPEAQEGGWKELELSTAGTRNSSAFDHKVGDAIEVLFLFVLSQT